MKLISTFFEMNAAISPMSNFYDGKTVFLTGGSGFLGQLYIQKLLRSKISVLYLFMRPKRGESILERLVKLFDNPVFDKLKLEVPNYLDKIKVISGSLDEVGLGINEDDRNDINDNVELVIHAAADVRFNRSLIELVKVNLNGTRELLKLSKFMRKLRLFTYISTCYSNCVIQTVEERIYDPPIDPDLMTEIAEKYTRGGEHQEIFELLTHRFIHPWPNTYTFTKALSETIVNSYANDFPICIIRPAIVTSTYKDPEPGWVLNFFGFVGLLYAVGLGIFRVHWVANTKVLDFICADFVTNSTLAAIWSSDDDLLKIRDERRAQVFNVASGRTNPVTIAKLQECSAYASHIPAYKSIWYPVLILVKYKIIYIFLNLFLHIIPAVLIDMYLKCTKAKIRLLPIYRNISFNMDALLYFGTREWTFMDDNMRRVYDKMSDFDKKLFLSDIRVVDWRNYFYDLCHGLRKYILKDRTDWTTAFRRISILHALHLTTKYLFIGMCVYVLYSFGFEKYFKWTSL